MNVMKNTPGKAPVCEFLDTVNLDWANDFEQAAEESRAILQQICGTPGWLDDLFTHAEQDAELREKAEGHQLLDYIVLYDKLDRGVRLRLHLSTEDHLQRPHDHRFDFSTRVLCGSYEHCLIIPRLDPYKISPEPQAIHYQDRFNPDPNLNLLNEDLQESFVRQVKSGSTLSLSNNVIHTVKTAADTVSLVLRGPARKNRSFIFDRGSEAAWWRFGAADETSARRSDKVMSDAKFQQSKEHFQRLNIIK